METKRKLQRVAALALLVAVPVAATATIASVASAPKALAADHIDSPAPVADPTADITDVYGFMAQDKVVLVLNVVPFATTASKFSSAIQYVIHTESTDSFGVAGQAKDIIATFDETQKIQLWVGTDVYLTGDASATTGLKSADGKVTVFAGLRDDPFFFNLEGFQETTKIVTAAAGSLTFNMAGCPAVDGATSTALLNQLKNNKMGMPGTDTFAGANVMALVVELDKSLLNASGPLLAVWGSTNKVQ